MLRTDFSLSSPPRASVFLAMTSSTVCAPALKDKHAMATNIKREKRQTEEKLIPWTARKSALMRSPKHTHIRRYIKQNGPKRGKIKLPSFSSCAIAWFQPNGRTEFDARSVGDRR